MTILLYRVPACNPIQMHESLTASENYYRSQTALYRFFNRYDSRAAKHKAQSRSFQLDKVEHYLLGLQDARVATNAGYHNESGKGADSRKVKIVLRPDLESEVIDAIKERMEKTYVAFTFS